MRCLALSGLLALLLGPAAWAQDVTIATAQGDVTLPAGPERVAVMDMAALDTLAALEVQPVARPDPILVDYLPQLQQVDAAGTLHEPDLETLARLGPDLIIIGGRSAPQMDSVSRVGTTIDMTVGTDLMADAKSRIEAYGTLFDRQEQAAELIAALDAQIAELQDAGEGQTALVVLTNGPKMSTYGRGSRFGWIFDATGLEEAVTGLQATTHGDAISHEFIARADPDWLIVIDRGAAIGEDSQSARATLDNALVRQTTAWEQQQVIYMNPSDTYISAGGYTALSRNLAALAEAMLD